ncbi:MAG: 30S ribosomal protein S17 [Patescibacteria group bacterium]|nr:30S ribosomal protein S17 [Patescibacteria group bacterium]
MEDNKKDKNLNKGKSVIKKKFNGIVVSDKMDKTIVVKVDRVKVHSKYKKRYTVSKKYKVHDEKNKFKEGDKVTFVECRPLSKDKRWRALYKTNSHKLMTSSHK